MLSASSRLRENALWASRCISVFGVTGQRTRSKRKLMVLTDAWFLLIGLASGVCAGLLGLGGGIVVVPALLALGVLDNAADAVGTSVFVVLVNALVGVCQHARRGHVRVRRGLRLAVGAVPMAFLTGCFVKSVPEALLRGLFGVFVLVLAVFLGRRPRQGKEARVATERKGGAFLVGSASGTLAGVFGVGGGVLLVPMQVLLMGADMLSAAGTSLLVIFVSSSSALVAHAFVSQTVQWDIGLWIVAGGMVGASLGVRLGQHLGDRNLRQVFVGFLVVLSSVMIWKAIDVL